MTVINARQFVGTGFPTDEGRKLGRHILEVDREEWSSLEVDVRECRASLLISAFFNAFLQQVYEDDPASLEMARAIHWKLKHEFQRENVSRWIRDFEPSDSPVEASR